MTNELIHEALHPHPADLGIATKVGSVAGAALELTADAVDELDSIAG